MCLRAEKSIDLSCRTEPLAPTAFGVAPLEIGSGLRLLVIGPPASTKTDIDCAEGIRIALDAGDQIVASKRVVANFGPRDGAGVPRCETAGRAIDSPLSPVESSKIDSRIVALRRWFSEPASVDA